jgi:hypothetical protein
LILYRSRGLVKRWQDRYGNLLLNEFSPHTLALQLDNEDTPEPGDYGAFKSSGPFPL